MCVFVSSLVEKRSKEVFLPDRALAFEDLESCGSELDVSLCRRACKTVRTHRITVTQRDTMIGVLRLFPCVYVRVWACGRASGSTQSVFRHAVGSVTRPRRPGINATRVNQTALMQICSPPSEIQRATKFSTKKADRKSTRLNSSH